RFQGPELQLRRGRKFTAADGISEMKVAGMEEDSHGKIWVSLWGDNLYSYLYCYDPARNGPVVFQRIPLKSISPFYSIITIMSDRTESLWLRTTNSLARFRDGTILTFEPSEGLPEANPRAFFQDSRGWLWIGLRYKGVSM